MLQPPQDVQKENWRRKLYYVIFEAESKSGKIFDILLLWAIILSVFSVLLESDQSIRQNYGVYLRYAEWFFTILFSIEYILRVICVDRPVIYMRSFFGIVDFISIAPTYLSLFFAGTQYLIVIRAIRLLRVFRVLKLARYLRESEVLMNALKASREKITVFIGVILTVVIVIGTIMHLIESNNPAFSSIFKSMYWAIVTMTTVGYGDAVPMTSLGKFVASLLMIMGYGIIAVPTGIVSAELTHAKSIAKTKLVICGCCGEELNSPEAKFCHHCGQAHDSN